MQYSNGAITVAAVLTSSERQRIEVAAGGVFSLVHRDSVRDAATVVRERPVDAVLVSVHRCGREQVDAVRSLVRDFPGHTERYVTDAQGYAAVVVNGSVLLEDAVHTGALPGEVLRGG